MAATAAHSVQDATTAMYQHILLPTDGSPVATRALYEAIRWAKRGSARLRLLHVVSELVMLDVDPPVYLQGSLEVLRRAGAQVLDRAAQLARAEGVTAETTLLESIGARPADLIVEQAKSWPADLIVMGTHGRRGLRRAVLGSDAELVVRDSPVPVLLVRSVREDT